MLQVSRLSAPEVLDAYSSVLSYKNQEVISKIVDDLCVNEKTAEMAFHSFKQFIAIKAFCQSEVTPSVELDRIWHIFLIYTKHYRGFCNEYFGNFIDHSPTDHASHAEQYLATRDLATTIFGRLDEKYWPNSRGAAARC